MDIVKTIIGSIPIYYINLDRASERKDKLVNLFELSGIINYKRVKAIDGNELDLTQYNSKYTFTKLNLSVYEIACLESHINAIKMALIDNCDFALIMEDDVNFDYIQYKTLTLSELIENLNEIEPDWDIIQCAQTTNRKNFAKLSKITDKEFVCGWESGAMAYIINKKAMNKIIENFTNIQELTVSENYIFGISKTFMTKPYFSYYYRNDVSSLIRDNSKSSMATQTIAKRLWDEFYGIKF